MRKLFALAAMAVLALTLSLGTIGCAPKAEETPAETTTTTTTTETTTETVPVDTTMMADTTTTH
jgi:PBP1b-binding outer membrane lipoprotein LpoB